MLENALGLLAIAQKGGNIQIGEEPVGAVARGGKARLIILASDAAGHTQRRANSFGAVHQTPIVSIDATKDALGAMFGRSSVAMAALTDVQLAKSFLERLDAPDRYGPQLTAVSEKAAALARRSGDQRGRNRKKGKKS